MENVLKESAITLKIASTSLNNIFLNRIKKCDFRLTYMKKNLLNN